MSRKSIGLCFSGGGHRASIFSLGALLYLVDAGRHHDIRVISSVSGGSLTGGFLAVQEKPLNEMNRESQKEFDVWAAKWARQIAGNPAWWWTAVTLHSALFLIGLILLIHQPAWLTSLIPYLSHWWGVVIGYLITVCLCARAIGNLPGGTFWGWWGTWLYVSIAIPTAFLLFYIVWQCPVYVFYLATVMVCFRFLYSLPGGRYWDWSRVLGLVALVAALPFTLKRWDPVSWKWHLPAIVLAAFALALRGQVADRAFRNTVCKAKRRDRPDEKQKDKRLSEIHRSPQYIFCATEMQTGSHVYFSSDFIYSSDTGLGEPADLHLSTALQASANFPVVFPYRSLSIDHHQFELVKSLDLLRGSRSLVLSDGGVYDNTGVAWFLDSAERKADLKSFLDLKIARGGEYDSPTKPIRKRVEEQLASMEPHPELLIVVNSSYPPYWSSVARRRIPLLDEITAVLNLENTLYGNRGRQQCRDLHRQFWLQLRKGAMVSIEQIPEIFPIRFRGLGCFRHWPYILDPDRENLVKSDLDDALREIGVSDLHNDLLEDYTRRSVAVTDNAIFGPEYETVIAAYAKCHRELGERLEQLRAVRAPEWEIRKCELEQRKICLDIWEKRSRWEIARSKELSQRGKETKRSRTAPTTFRPLGAKATSELLRHGYLNCMDMCYLLLEGFPFFYDPPSREDFDRLAHGLVRDRYPKERFTAVPNTLKAGVS